MPQAEQDLTLVVIFRKWCPIMKKLLLLSALSAFLVFSAGCSSSIDKEVTLIRGETTTQEVEALLGYPHDKVQEGNRLRYDYGSSSMIRDVTTELLLGWRFLDNHVLTLCDPGNTNCELFKGGEDEEAKSLRIYFENNVVTDAELLDL